MLKAFIFVLSIVTNDGELQMKAFNVEACPDKAGFSTAMDNLKSKGEMKEWNAICIPIKPQGQDT